MADTDKLRAYKRGTPPALPDNGRYIAEQLRQIEDTLGTVTIVLKALEARMAAHGI
jgi:hypothetical protein